MSSYKLNRATITSREFSYFLRSRNRNPVVTVGLGVFTICMFFLTVGAFVSNSVTASTVSVIILAILRVVNFVRFPVPITIGSVFRLIGTIIFFAGLWQHNWVLVILGVLLSIKYHVSAR